VPGAEIWNAGKWEVKKEEGEKNEEFNHEHYEPYEPVV